MSAKVMQTYIENGLVLTISLDMSDERATPKAYVAFGDVAKAAETFVSTTETEEQK